jgi:hypothetical protein
LPPLRSTSKDPIAPRRYDGPGYENFIYTGVPQPALSVEDAEWARLLLPSSPAASIRPQ